MPSQNNTPLRPFAIAASGSSRAYVLDPSNWQDIYTFATRKEARAYADSILGEMPSKYCPLRVVVWNGTGEHGC